MISPGLCLRFADFLRDLLPLDLKNLTARLVALSYPLSLPFLNLRIERFRLGVLRLRCFAARFAARERLSDVSAAARWRAEPK